jgi:hypothetical protein
MGRSYRIRWQSAGTYLELPLVSIAFGPDPLKNESHGRARGIIAIGDIATGVIAVGPLARDVIGAGCLRTGR